MTNSPTPLPDDWLSAYLDGELTEVDRAQVEAWLARDASARSRLERLRAVSQELRALPRAAFRREASERLLESLKQETTPQPTAVTGAVGRAAKPIHDASVHDGRRRWTYVLATLATAAAVTLLVSPRGEQDTQVSQAPAARDQLREEAVPLDAAPDDGLREDVAAAERSAPKMERMKPRATSVREASKAAADAPPEVAAASDAQAAGSTASDAPAAGSAASDAPAAGSAVPDLEPMHKESGGGRAAPAPASAAAALAVPDPAGELAAGEARQAAPGVLPGLVEIEVAPEQRDALLRQLAEGLANDLARARPSEGLDSKETFYVDEEGSHWMVVAMDAAALLTRLEAWPQARVTSKDLASESTATQRSAVEAARRASPPAEPAATPAPLTLLRIR